MAIIIALITLIKQEKKMGTGPFGNCPHLFLTALIT